MLPEVQKDVNLGTIGIETIVDGHLPREGVDRNDGARGVPHLGSRGSKGTHKGRNEEQLKKQHKLGSVANSTVTVIIANTYRLFTLCQTVNSYCVLYS